MALTVSATDSELPNPVNTLFSQTFLRNAKVRAPYFLGTTPGIVTIHQGSSQITWRRIENLATTEGSALTELTGVAAYMQGRDAAALSVTNVSATPAKYGNFVILNEEVQLYEPTTQDAKIFEVIGINAGQTLNKLQRNVAEDNLTIIRQGGVASDGLIASAITADTMKSVLNILDKNSAMPFTPMTTGSVNINTTPILPAYWLLCHPDVALDVTSLSGFVSVERYAGQTATVMGEFGIFSAAGVGARCVSSEDASVAAGAGISLTSQDLVTTISGDADVYDTVVYGQDCLGSAGLGFQHTDGSFRAGDEIPGVDVIIKGLGSGGSSDPFNEISTIAWKSWHAGAVLNSTWGRTLRTAATDYSN